MNTKRWSVWLCLLTLVVGLRGARAQESDTPLIDDVSKPTAKAVKDLPLPANLEAKAQIQIDFVMWDIDGKELAKILGDSKEPVIEFIQRNGIELPTKRGPEPLVHVLRKPLKFDVRGKDVSSAFKKLTAPTVMTLSGQEATVLSGGALPVPLPTDALGSREVVMREFGQKFVVKPVWLNEGKIFIDLTAEDSRLTEPVVSVGDAQVPSIFSRRVSATCNLQPGETLLILNGPTESAFIQLVEVTPRVANDPQPVILANPPKAVPPAPQATAGKPQSAPKTPDNSKPVGILKGKGVNSDAGVVGNIVLQNKDRQTRLEATSLTLDVPKVVNLGVEIGQAGALMECGNPHNPARLIAPLVVLEDTKGPSKSEDGFLSATATLKLTSNATFESIQNLKPEGDRQIFLVPIPEGQKAMDRTQAQRIFEHAFFRVLARNEADHSEKQPWQVAEIAQGQRMIRVPVKHEAYLLLPTPTGNVPGFRYVAAAKSEHGGAKRIAGLTVLFVSESVSQLESLIEALEPTAVVTVIEVREAVVLRGTVTDEAQKKSLIEIAEQLYPKVLDQLKAQAPSTEIGRAVPHPERLNASPTKTVVIQQVAGEDFAEPPLAAKKEAPLRSEKRQSPQIVPGKLPTVEELKELRDDIKGLRQDVQRLSELMERDRKTSAATKSAEAAKAEALTRRVEAAKDEEGVLVVTSKQRAKGELLVKAYAVADLVVPLPANPLSNELNPDAKPKHNSQALMDLVKTTIQPNTWDEMGGAGSLRFNDATLSLVIRTTANVHQEITELLSQLRKLHDTQVTLEMSIISIRDDLVPREINGSTEVSSLVLTQTARQSFVEKWQADRLTNIIAAPKITLFNGQTASLSSNELGSKDHVVNLVMNGTASGDRKSVRLSLGINGESFDTAIRRQQETLQEGQSLILDITDDISAPAELLKKLPIATDSDEARDILKSIRPKDGSRVLLLVTPRVIVVEENE